MCNFLDHVCLGTSHLCWLFCRHSFLCHRISGWSTSCVPGCLQGQDLSRPFLLCQGIRRQQWSCPRLLSCLCHYCHLYSNRKSQSGDLINEQLFTKALLTSKFTYNFLVTLFKKKDFYCFPLSYILSVRM